jgi:serine/threonine protein kinase
MVTEFAEGCDLRTLIDHQSALGAARSITIARQILAGLAEAHDLGLLHRDIKPSNVVFSQHAHMRDHVRIIDYGMALPEGQQQRWAKAEVDEDLIGTPRYMSPEQLLGQEPSPSSDVYSVGIVLYEMLSGLPAFEGDSVVDLMRQQIHEKPPPLSMFVTMPDSLVSIVHKAIQKDPARRYQSVAAFIDALELVDLTHHRPGFTATGPHTPVPPAPNSEF